MKLNWRKHHLVTDLHDTLIVRHAQIFQVRRSQTNESKFQRELLHEELFADLVSVIVDRKHARLIEETVCNEVPPQTDPPSM